jgi:hypothetical protein
MSTVALWIWMLTVLLAQVTTLYGESVKGGKNNFWITLAFMALYWSLLGFGGFFTLF